MLNHFETLCNLCVSSGDESEVRNYILSVLRETKRCYMGNRPAGQFAGTKQGKKTCSAQADDQCPYGRSRHDRHSRQLRQHILSGSSRRRRCISCTGTASAGR